MNKAIVLLAITSLTLTGCKKDRVCNCTVPANGSVAEQKFTYLLEDTKKRPAKNSCKIANDTYKLAGGNCQLD